jgi:hypothetical protein
MAANRARRLSVWRQARPVLPPGLRLKRHVPGTRFVIGELLPQRLQGNAKQVFESAVKQGLIQMVPERLVSGESHPERFYFIPMQRPTQKDPRTLHQRVISAKLPFGKRKRSFNAKGSGAPFGFYDSSFILPFFEIRQGVENPHKTSKQYKDFVSLFKDGRPVSRSQRFFGGMLRGSAKKASGVASLVLNEFRRAVKDNDPVARAAQKLGVESAPIPVFFGSFKPRQAIMQFFKNGSGQSQDIQQVKGVMSPSEQKAFDYAFNRAKRGETIELKIARGAELAGLNESLRDSQAVQFLSLESNTRVHELGNLYHDGKIGLMNAPLDLVMEKGKFIKAGPFGDGYDQRELAGSALRNWVDVFGDYGFELRPGGGVRYLGTENAIFGNGPAFTDYAVYRKGKRVAMETAVHEIVKKFATNLALGYHLVDTRLGRTFHKRSLRASGDAIKSKDVTVRGEIADLEDINLKPSQKNLRDYQAYDYNVAADAVKALAEKISRHRSGETKWGEEEKALTEFGLKTFRGLIAQGIRHMEARRKTG